MKKTVLILTAMMITLGCYSQDTLHTCRPLDNYLYNQWHNYKEGDSVWCWSMSEHYPYYAINGIVMYNYDTLPIYGVAIGVDLDPADDRYSTDAMGHPYRIPADTSLDESYMHLMLLQVDSNVVYLVGDSVQLHMKYTPVSYYVEDGLYERAQWRPGPCDVFPVYELYFDSTITVYDKFYLAASNHSDECDWEYNLHPSIRVIGRNRWQSVPVYNVIRWLNITTPIDSSWVTFDGWQEYQGTSWQWLFPILTPNPDTTFYVPDDSTQTGMPLAAWERYVAVQPNPATDKASVLSSVGLTQVEVFDMAGSRVLRQEVSGLSAKVDVAALPRGTYIVRIHTPMGTTSRKLLLQ